MIHPTASIDPSAVLGPDVRIGPYCVVGPDVSIGRATVLDAHVHVHRWTTIGENCRFSSFGSIGGDPQDLKYRGEESWLRIGDRNVFREFVTVNRGTEVGGGATSMGDGNFLMAYAHVAHDSRVGSHVIMANAATLAGHVVVGDHSTIGAFSAVHQFCRVGAHAFIGGFSVITRDALPFVKTVGDRNQARIYGINAIGLERAGFAGDTITELKRAYRLLFRSELNTGDALRRAREVGWQSPEVEVLFRFVETAQRGFVR